MKGFWNARRKRIVFKGNISPEHREYVENWLKYVSFGRLKRYSDLTVILEQLGIKMPIEVYLTCDNHVYFHSGGKSYLADLFLFSDPSITIRKSAIGRGDDYGFKREYEINGVGDTIVLRKTQITKGEYKNCRRIESDYTQLVKWTYKLLFDEG